MNNDRTRERTIEQAEADAQAMVDELERLVEQLRLARAETSAGAGADMSSQAGAGADSNSGSDSNSGAGTGASSDTGLGSGVSTQCTPTSDAQPPSQPQSQPRARPLPESQPESQSEFSPGGPFPAIPDAQIRTFPATGMPLHPVRGARSRFARKSPAHPSPNQKQPANQPTNAPAAPPADAPEATTVPSSAMPYPRRASHRPRPPAARLSWVEARSRRIRLAPALGLAAVALVGIVGAAAVTAVRDASGPDGGSGMEPIPYARTASGGPGSAGGARLPLGALSPRAGADAAPGPRHSTPGPSVSGSASESAAARPPGDQDATQEGSGTAPTHQPRSAPSGAASSGLNAQVLAQALRQAEEAEAKELQALAQSFAPTGPVPRLPPYGGQRRAR